MNLIERLDAVLRTHPSNLTGDDFETIRDARAALVTSAAARSMLSASYTYAVLDVSPQAYAQIRTRLRDLGCEHMFVKDGGREVIDMHGVAIAKERKGA